MRALIPTGRPGDLVEIADIDRPVPADDQALVRVTEFALNRVDYLQLRIPDTTYRPGIDAVGVVETAAADGSGPLAEQRVAIHLPAGGTAAEYIAVTADRVVPVPDGVPSDVAAALPLAGLVARRMLDKAGNLSGRRILATGVSGGVGQFVVQLAVAEGAQVTAYAAESEPWQHLPALGARVIHDVTTLDNGSFDIVLESIGGSVGSTAAKKLTQDGLFLWFGQASDQPLTLDFFSLFEGGQSLTLHHFVYFASDTNQDARDMAALLDLANQGKLRAEIGHRDDWSRTSALLDEIANGRLRGKAILTIG